MNHDLNFRILFVLRRASRTHVSADLECSESLLLSARRTAQCNASLLACRFKAPEQAQLSDLIEPLHPSSLIQST